MSRDTVFQIAYTETLRQQRAKVLRSRGYRVVSVIGNESAKALLTTSALNGDDFALFMIGHAASQPARDEIVEWLKANYPKAKIIALNPPNQTVQAADFNVLQNGPELWLTLLRTVAKNDRT